MIKVIKPRNGGKTSELIDISSKTGYVIVVEDGSRVEEIVRAAHYLDIIIPKPLTYHQVLRTQSHRGTFNRHILIDNVEHLLNHLFNGLCVGFSASSETEHYAQHIPSKRNRIYEEPLPFDFKKKIKLSGEAVERFKEAWIANRQEMRNNLIVVDDMDSHDDVNLTKEWLQKSIIHGPSWEMIINERIKYFNNYLLYLINFRTVHQYKTSAGEPLEFEDWLSHQGREDLTW